MIKQNKSAEKMFIPGKLFYKVYQFVNNFAVRLYSWHIAESIQKHFFIEEYHIDKQKYSLLLKNIIWIYIKNF